jgi:hypothetical protein
MPDPISKWPAANDAEGDIHSGIDQSKIQGPDFFAETNLEWHPLKDAWALQLNPLSAPDPPTVGEKCMMDCKERERTRKRECAEIRKRVQAKLKDLGCPSTVKSTDKTTMCGREKGGVAVKAKPSKAKAKGPKRQRLE